MAQKMGGNNRVFILSDVRQIVCEMAFYVDGKPRTYRWNMGGQVGSQYGIWKGINERIDQDAIFVTKVTKKFPANLGSFFKSVGHPRILKVPIRKDSYKKFKVFVCRGFLGVPSQE